MGYLPRVPLDPKRSDDSLPGLSGRAEHHLGSAVPTCPSFHSTEASLLEHSSTLSRRQGPCGQLGPFSHRLVLLEIVRSPAEEIGAELPLVRL